MLSLLYRDTAINVILFGGRGGSGRQECTLNSYTNHSYSHIHTLTHTQNYRMFFIEFCFWCANSDWFELIQTGWTRSGGGHGGHNHQRLRITRPLSEYPNKCTVRWRTLGVLSPLFSTVLTVLAAVPTVPAVPSTVPESRVQTKSLFRGFHLFSQYFQQFHQQFQLFQRPEEFLPKKHRTIQRIECAHHTHTHTSTREKPILNTAELARSDGCVFDSICLRFADEL